MSILEGSTQSMQQNAVKMLWDKDSLLPETCSLRRIYFVASYCINQLCADHKSIQAAAQHKTNFVSCEYNKIGINFINVLHYKQYK